MNPHSDLYIEVLDEVTERIAPSGISYGIDPDKSDYNWMTKDGKRLNFRIVDADTYMSWTLLEHVLNGQVQGRKWVSNTLLFQDPAAAYYDAKFHVFPPEDNKVRP